MLSRSLGFPCGERGKKSACNTGAAGDACSITGSGRSPGEEHGNPLQYSCLENPMDRETWWATVHSVAKSTTQLKRLSTLQAQDIVENKVWTKGCVSSLFLPPAVFPAFLPSTNI